MLGTKMSKAVGTAKLVLSFPKPFRARISARNSRKHRKPSTTVIARSASDEDRLWSSVSKVAFVGASIALSATVCSSSAHAFAERKVGEFNASGLIFKDAVEVVAIDDPDVDGVTLYYSDFKRSFADKLAKLDFFNEPSQASITCAATGPVAIKEGSKIGGSSGREVFSEEKSRSLIFFGNKTLKIRRIYDEGRQALLYVSYSTRITSAGEDGQGVSAGRYKTSICAVPVLPNAPSLVGE